MNKQKKEFIHIGFSSILMVFTMLCLVTFATLSLITANSDYRLSLKVAEKQPPITKQILLQGTICSN